MARKTQPHDVIALHFDGLVSSVRKLLIKNPNFKTSEDGPHNRREAFYFREYPRTDDFVRGVLKGQAEFIIEKIEELKTLAVDFTDIKQISDDELAAEVNRRKSEALAQQDRLPGNTDVKALAAAAADEVRRSYGVLNADELALTVSSAVTMRAEALARAGEPDLSALDVLPRDDVPAKQLYRSEGFLDWDGLPEALKENWRRKAGPLVNSA